MDKIYFSFIQNSINYYLKNDITDFEKTLKYFAKSRNVIAKIMNEIEEKTNSNKFCKKQDVIYFGMFRTDVIITPLSGRYQSSFLDLCKHSCENNNNILSKDIVENGDTYTKIRYSLLQTSKEINTKYIDINDYLSERCIIHTNPSKFKKIKEELEILYYNYLTYNNKDGDDVIYFIRIIWLLSQATFFKRGSASITEMIMNYLSMAGRHNKDKYSEEIINKICQIKGIDLIAIYNNYDDFEKFIMDCVDNIEENCARFIKQEFILNMDELEDFYYTILKSGKNDVKKYLLEECIDIYNSYINLKNNLNNKSKEKISYSSFISDLNNLFEDAF